MYIGIDLGTSGVKTLLMSDAGAVLRTVTKQYDVDMPQSGWTEQAPEMWLNQTIAALTELVKGHEDDIVACSFSGQMHGMVTLDATDQVLRPAILWNDQRTAPQVEALIQHFGFAGNQQMTQNIPLTGLTAPKVLWMKEHEPRLFERIAKIMLPKDYLVYCLTGAFVTDVSDVSGTHYYDVQANKYSAPMLDFLSINETVLPSVVESDSVVGTLLPKWQTVLGLTQPINVIVGGGDQAVGAIGVGVVKPGMASLSLGTSGVFFVPTTTSALDSLNHLQSYRDASHHFHVMGVLLNAAGVIKWWVEDVLASTDYNGFYAAIEPLELSSPLFYVPHMSGERFPVNDPHATGVFYGIGYQHNQVQLGRAVVEGVTLSLKEAFEKIKQFQPDITTLRLTGGGARSDIWAQMIADALDVTVVKLSTEEGPSYGAAMLAYAGHTNSAIAQISTAFIKVGQSFTPQAAKTRYFASRFDQFITLYPEIKSIHQTFKL